MVEIPRFGVFWVFLRAENQTKKVIKMPDFWQNVSIIAEDEVKKCILKTKNNLIFYFLTLKT